MDIVLVQRPDSFVGRLLVYWKGYKIVGHYIEGYKPIQISLNQQIKLIKRIYCRYHPAKHRVGC